MKNIRRRIDKWFEKLAHIIYQNNKKTLLLMLVINALFISQIPKLKLDSSVEGLLHKEDPARIAYTHFRDQFGRDELIVVAISSPDIFNLKFLEKLKSFHTELEKGIPHVKKVISLINAKNIRGNNDQIIVENFFEKWPKTDSDIIPIKQRILENPLYKNLLISKDATLTTVLIQTDIYSSIGEKKGRGDNWADEQSFEEGKMSSKEKPSEKVYLTDPENSEAVIGVMNVMKKFKGSDFEMHIAGSPVLQHEVTTAFIKDFGKFVILLIISVLILLFVMFKRVSGVFLPFIVVFAAFLSTMGLMAIFKAPLTLPSQILPIFLFSVGVTDSIHILSVFFQNYNDKNSKEDVIVYTLGHSGLAITMTAVATAVGLASFSGADLAPISDLGIYASTGIMLSLLYTIILLPAFLSILPIKPIPVKKGENKAIIDKILMKIGMFSIKRPYWVIFVSIFLLVVSMIGISKVYFSHNPVKWFPENHHLRLAIDKIDKKLGGSNSLEIIIDTQKKEGIYEPDFLARIDDAVNYLESFDEDGIKVGKAISFTNIIKEINQALNGNKKEFYSIPKDNKLAAQEMYLFNMNSSDDLEKFTNPSGHFTKARITATVPFIDSMKYIKFLDSIKKYFDEKFSDAKVMLTGMLTVYAKTIVNMMTSMRTGFIWAVLLDTILLIIFIGRVRIGLVGMIPNITPIIMIVGFMGWRGIEIDVFTMLIGSVSIGLAVDDTIHFLHNFRKFYEETGDPEAAIMKNLKETGRAIFITSIILSIGFFMLLTASRNDLFNFGLLTGMTILIALLTELFQGPALMVILNKKKNYV